MKAPRSRQAGLTLVELMSTLAIVAILAGTAVPSFAGWQAASRIRASADIFHAGLRLARFEAIARNATVTFTMQPDGSWSVGCATVTATCPATIQSRPADINGSVSLAVTQRDGDSSSGASSVSFNSRGTPDTSPSSLRALDITVANALAPSMPGRQLRITLSEFGQTRMCDPGAASGSPTSC